MIKTSVNRSGSKRLVTKMQLRLQQEVEGLSVAAISFYGVSLAGYLIKPFGKTLGVDGDYLTAPLAIPVIGHVWWIVRKIRRSNDVEDREFL